MIDNVLMIHFQTRPNLHYYELKLQCRGEQDSNSGTKRYLDVPYFR
jgi:hypothetical protein